MELQSDDLLGKQHGSRRAVTSTSMDVWRLHLIYKLVVLQAHDLTMELGSRHLHLLHTFTSLRHVRLWLRRPPVRICAPATVCSHSWLHWNAFLLVQVVMRTCASGHAYAYAAVARECQTGEHSHG